MSFKGLVGGMLDCIIPTFGETVKYFHKNGGSVTISAVFDRRYEAIDPNSEAIVSSNAPQIGVKDADLLKKPLKGDRVVVKATNEEFIVQDTREDGQGHTKLFLYVKK
jgi:hypothetical protein